VIKRNFLRFSIGLAMAKENLAQSPQGKESTALPETSSVHALKSPGRRGLMLILSSPSGAGKTTLTRMLLQTKDLDLTLSISITTRPRRSSEVDGIHYHFISKKQFGRFGCDHRQAFGQCAQ
jgi:guanylate kinase